MWPRSSVRCDEVAHLGVDPVGNLGGEHASAHFHEFVVRLALQCADAGLEQLGETSAAETGVDTPAGEAEELCDGHVATTQPIFGHDLCRESVDDGSVEIEESRGALPAWARLDLGHRARLRCI